MRAAMVMMASVALVGCNIGDVGGPEPTTCELAAQHVASCLGASEIVVDGTCDANAGAQAESVLQQPCSALVGDRSTMSLKDFFCKLLPFLCSGNNGGSPGPGPGQPAGQASIFRIGDCWSDPQWGFCYDIVKIESNCTAMLERPEWQLPHYSRYQCLEPDGARCRLVRVCQQLQDKGQCVNSVPHHNDLPKCQAQQPHDQPPPNQPPPNQPPAGNPGSCNNDSECGGGICYWNHTCIPAHSQPQGATCQTACGAFAAAVCQQGLGCKISFANGQAHSECAPTPNWP